MIRGLYAMVVCLCSAVVAGAADVSVHVVDSQKAAIGNATVALVSRDGERRALTTDAAGACRFVEVVAGSYFVQAEAQGFEASSPKPVELKLGDAEVTLALGVAGVHTSIVVTASGTPQTTDEVSKALTVVDGSEINLRADKSVGDAVADVPGLRVEQLGGPLSTMYFKIRGLRNTDTAVLVDGLRLRDAAGTQADASGVLQDLVIADTSRIEILRGAGSSLYGTDATAGVVNIVTDDGGGRTRGSVALDGGSLGSVHGAVHLAGGFHDDRIQYSFGATHWNVMSGVDGDSPARNTSGQGQVTFRLSRIMSLTARIYAGDSFGFNRISPFPLGTPPASGIVDAVAAPLAVEHAYEAGAPLPTSLGAANYMPAVFDPDNTRAGRFFTGALKFTVRPSDKFGFTAQYQDVYTRRNYGDGPGGPGFQPTGSSLADYLGRIQTANARVDFTLGKFQKIDAGYEFETEYFQSLLTPPAPEIVVNSTVSQRSHALFAQDQLRFLGGRLQIAAAYRAQFFALNQPTFEPAAGAPFPTLAGFNAPPTAQTGDISAAYTLRRSGTKIRAHAGRGYRAPSLYERFGVYYDGTGYELFGDPRLRPDRSNSIDGGIDQTFWNSRMQVSATYFFTRLNEVIIFDTSGAITPLTDPLGRYGGYRNTGGGLARGVEFSARIAATRRLQITGAYSYTDAREEIPLFPGVWQSFEAPRHQFSFFATERFSSRWTALFGHIGSDSYLAPVYGNPYRFHGPERAQAELSYRRPMSAAKGSDAKALRFFVKANNLFNQTYYESGFLAPGITFTGGTQFEF
jgi:vitamin B12 transporter